MKTNKRVYKTYQIYKNEHSFFHFLVKKSKELQKNVLSTRSSNEIIFKEENIKDRSFYKDFYKDTISYVFYFLTGYYVIEREFVQNPSKDPEDELYEFRFVDENGQILDSLHCLKSIGFVKPRKCVTGYIKEFETEAMGKNPVIRYMYSLKGFEGEHCLSEEEYEKICTEILNEFLISVLLEKEKRYEAMCETILTPQSKKTVKFKVFSCQISENESLKFIELSLAIAILTSIYRALFYKLLKTGTKCYLDKNKSYQSIIDKFDKRFREKESIDTLLLQREPEIVHEEEKEALCRLERLEKIVNPPKKGSKVYIWDGGLQMRAIRVIKILGLSDPGTTPILKQRQ